MTAPSVDDPIRAEVERYLHLAVETVIALPLAVSARTQRCARAQLGRAGDRLLAPWRLVRSLIDAAGTGSVVVPVDDDVPTPVLHPGVRRSAPPAVAGRGTAGGSTTTVAPSPPADVDDLPIEEYESLAASHVVARLAQLTPDELRRLQEFESANRGRRTVLGKIEQLLGRA